MRPLAALGVLIFGLALNSSMGAPVAEYSGPPQTIEGERNSMDPSYDQRKNVQEMERFHRTYENGTVEFKMALNNGHVQYQRISTKCVEGNKIQVYEGYISERYKDGRYGTRYYVADENGYRSSPVIVENMPPKLPTSGPYALNEPRDSENELPQTGQDDNQIKTKTLTDNLIDLEEEQLTNNDVNPVPTVQSEFLNQSSEERNLEKEGSEEPLVPHIEDILTTEGPSQYPEIHFKTEGLLLLNSGNGVDKVPEDLELSTSRFEEDPITEQPLNEVSPNINMFEISTELPNQENTKVTEEEFSGRNFHEGEIFPTAEIVPNLETTTELSEATTEGLLEDKEISTHIPNLSNGYGQEEGTLLPKIELNDLEASTILPIDGITETRTILNDIIVPQQPAIGVPQNINILEENTRTIEEENSGRSFPSSVVSEGLEEGIIVSRPETLPKLETNTELSEATTEGLLEDKEISTHIPDLSVDGQEEGTYLPKVEPNDLEASTILPIDEIAETTIGTLLNDIIMPEQPAIGVPENTNILDENTKVIEEENSGRSFPSSEVSEGLEEEVIVSSPEIVSNFEAITEISTNKISETTIKGDVEDRTVLPNLEQDDLEVSTILPVDRILETTPGTLLSEQQATDIPENEVSTELPNEESTKVIEEENSGRSFPSVITEFFKDVKEAIIPTSEVESNPETSTNISTEEITEGTTEGLLNDKETSTLVPDLSRTNDDLEVSTKLPIDGISETTIGTLLKDDISPENPATDVPKLHEIKTDDETSKIVIYPTYVPVTGTDDDKVSTEQSTEVPSTSIATIETDKEITTELPKPEETSEDILLNEKDSRNIDLNNSTSSTEQSTTTKVETSTEVFESTTILNENRDDVLPTIEGVTEKDSTTELPEESSDENNTTGKIVEIVTEKAPLSTNNDETTEKDYGVKVEFYHPVFHT